MLRQCLEQHNFRVIGFRVVSHYGSSSTMSNVLAIRSTSYPAACPLNYTLN